MDVLSDTRTLSNHYPKYVTPASMTLNRPIVADECRSARFVLDLAVARGQASYLTCGYDEVH